MKILYFGFVMALTGWTLLSGLDKTMEMTAFYILTVILLAVLGIVLNSNGRKKTNFYLCGMSILLLMNVGASLSYRMNRVATEKLSEVSHSRQYFGDVIFACLAFFIVYVLVRYIKIYRIKLFNLIIVAGLPMILLITRMRGKVTGGAYISFFGILVFAVILIGYPFVAAYLLSRKEEHYFRRNIRSIPLNLLLFLGYTLLLYVGCAICNEFGLLLVLGIASTLLFYLRCRNFYTKLGYTALCAAGGILACAFTAHIKDRIYIWLHLSEIGIDNNLAGKAESVLYLFRNIMRTGFWGNGIGSLPVSIYPTLNTDHALVSLILEYSLIFAVIVVLCGGLYVKVMMEECFADDMYDYILNLSCALIVGAIVLIHIGSNLGSSITAGIGFPYVSEGSAVNIMLSILTAIHCGVYERGRENALSEKKGTYED